MPTDHFNGLTEAEDEALTLLEEECAEVIQAICKIKRHGRASCDPRTGVNNTAALEKEVGDVLSAMDIAVREGLINRQWVEEARQEKIRKFRANVGNLLHHIEPL